MSDYNYYSDHRVRSQNKWYNSINGRYDVQCYGCGGQRVMPVIDEDNCDPEILKQWKQEKKRMTVMNTKECEICDLDDAANAVNNLRMRLLFDDEKMTSGLSPISEQHYLQALSLLEQAQRSLKLADYFKMRNW